MNRFVGVLIALIVAGICRAEDLTVLLKDDSGLKLFANEGPANDKLSVQHATKIISVQDGKKVYGDKGQLAKVHKVTAKQINEKVLALETLAREGATLYKAWGTYTKAGGAGGGGGAALPQWDARYLRQTLPIYYIGGTDSTDGTQEGEKELAGDHILKGYILKCVCPGVPQGTQVTWTFKKGTETVGTFHEGYAWSNYSTKLDNPPTGATIYWRSPVSGNITDAYTVEATYTPQGGQPVTVSRTLTSRTLAPNNGDVRDFFCEDVDMLQRALIQVFFLDKGRLDRYAIGKYRDHSRSEYLYRSSLPGRQVPLWSAVADEVWNFDKFALNHAGSYTLALPQVQGLWNELSLILGAGDIGAVTTTHAQYGNWRNAAITAANLSLPQGFPKTAAQYLDGLVTVESTGKHSDDRHAPLAINSIRVGEASGGTPKHTWTDDGLGFMKVQPYNRGTRNLYKPDENLLQGTQLLAGHVNGAPGTNPSEKAWRAYVKYNSGNYGAGTPQQMRAAGSKPAYRADKLFHILGLSAGVSGTFTKNGQPLPGVAVTVTCQVYNVGGKKAGTTTTETKTAITAANGTYVVSGMVLNQTITVTPSKAGETFTPANRSVSIADADVNGQNFTAN